ncbi:metallophosphoesterase [Archangium violaceum]|uniref:metallophosphoesterase n=1 Tax=Archangium violaceum TaxID=83451 RepID=UPI002B2DB741|nr:metallophosphoesterase [Archangium gephyra]
MPSSATFLHLTDVHLASAGVEFARADHKVDVPEIRQDTREEVLDLTLGRLAERLRQEKRVLDGVIFSGDAQDRGRPGGHELLLELLLKHLSVFGVSPANIVAVPGNHDVPRASPPSSPARYELFAKVWRTAGCVTPWLDGLDSKHADGGAHRLAADDGSWAIFPLNSCNWSHVSITLPEPLASVWANLHELAAVGDKKVAEKLRSQLDGLARYDMARISSAQLEVLRGLIEATHQPRSGRQLRIAVVHHHLRAPSLREELKPFADYSNLAQLRAFLRERDIAMLVHGHKHEHAAQFEHIYDHDGERAHRTLVLSGATFEPGHEADGVRLLTIKGMPNSPSVHIEPIAVPRGGVDAHSAPAITRRLWASDEVPGGPVVIQGSDVDAVYERACEVAGADAANGTLIVHLDLTTEVKGELPLPSSYPIPKPMEANERQRWLKELVEWWQLERSGFEHRMPFVHGSRLRRYGGKIDQLKRIISLLREKASTRALAVLVDPFRDFTQDGTDEEFASFCLVEFKRRDLGSSRRAVDAIAFYRAQEFARWWPINIAELRFLQWKICEELGFSPGRITTIAADARTHSRTPTQVAMPIIDRWLDQAPERLHLLANALVNKQLGSEPQREAVRGWEQTLTDLEATAKEYNPDGLPIAIEGLNMLAAYLEVAVVSADSSLSRFTRTLRRLARSNHQFEDGARSKADFDRWSTDTLEAVSELVALTHERLGTQAA